MKDDTVINEHLEKIDTEWISIETRLPENATFILVWGSHSMPWMCEFIEGEFTDIEDCVPLAGITHWMPLPSPPNKKTGNK